MGRQNKVFPFFISLNEILPQSIDIPRRQLIAQFYSSKLYPIAPLSSQTLRFSKIFPNLIEPLLTIIVKKVNQTSKKYQSYERK